MMKKRLFIFLLTGILYLTSNVYAQTDNAVLIVTLYPEEINRLGALWKVSELGESWYSSGNMLTLSEGIYTIEFKGGIKGWKAPSSAEVTLIKGKTVKYAGIYERLKGSLRVNLFPPEVIAANDTEEGEKEKGGAKWRRVGQEVWLDSGAIEENVPVDVYEIEFKQVSGWNVPEKTLIDLKEGIINEVSATYTRQQGKLVVNILPEEVVQAGARWKLADETFYRQSGIIVTKDIGEYTIEFNDVPNWTKPSSIKVNIVSNDKVEVNAEYTPVSVQEGVLEGEGEGNGEGEGENPSMCGCNDKAGTNQLKQFLNNLFVVGMTLGILCMWMGVKKEDK